MGAIVVYAVWWRHKYDGDGTCRGVYLQKLFDDETNAYGYARRCNEGPCMTGDSWCVSEHALHTKA